MQFIVYSRKGDSLAMALLGQIRAVLASRGVIAQVQFIDDPALLRMNGIDSTPTVMLDGSYICCGHTPTRTELETAIERRSQALAISRRVHENHGETRDWR